MAVEDRNDLDPSTVGAILIKWRPSTVAVEDRNFNWLAAEGERAAWRPSTMAVEDRNLHGQHWRKRLICGGLHHGGRGSQRPGQPAERVEGGEWRPSTMAVEYRNLWTGLSLPSSFQWRPSTMAVEDRNWMTLRFIHPGANE